MPEKIVLVTGAAGYWGSRLAARLGAGPGCRVLGLDAEPLAESCEGLDFVQADIRNPLLAELLASEQVDTVCHLAFVDTRRPSEAAFDLNVIGTMKVLGACAAAGVRKIVLPSSTAVYGARATNPAFLTEDHPLQGSSRYGYVRDLVEIEAVCNGFRRQAPEVALAVLRFASIVGPTADTRLTRFLQEPWAPSLLGFDPMMQIIHEDDVVEALAHAVRRDVSGVFNVAAPQVLPLSKVRGLAGKPPVVVVHPFAYWAARLRTTGGLPSGRCLPIEPDYIRYPWVGDLTRMRQDLGFTPLRTAEETLREFAQRFRLKRYRSGSAGSPHAEERLHDIMAQRRRAREQQAAAAPDAAQGAGDG